MKIFDYNTPVIVTRGVGYLVVGEVKTYFRISERSPKEFIGSLLEYQHEINEEIIYTIDGDIVECYISDDEGSDE